MTAIPVLERLFFVVIVLVPLISGIVVTVKKRHEGWIGIRTGGFLMAIAFASSIFFNSVVFARNDYQQKDNAQETATAKVLDWYTGENQKARATVGRWLVEFVTD